MSTHLNFHESSHMYVSRILESYTRDASCSLCRCTVDKTKCMVLFFTMHDIHLYGYTLCTCMCKKPATGFWLLVKLVANLVYSWKGSGLITIWEIHGPFWHNEILHRIWQNFNPSTCNESWRKMLHNCHESPLLTTLMLSCLKLHTHTHTHTEKYSVCLHHQLGRLRATSVFWDSW